MSAEFVDTNIFVYAHDAADAKKHTVATELLTRLFEEGTGAISTQVLIEFYAAATRKMGIPHAEAQEIITDLGGWLIHRPSHADLIRASKLARRSKLNWFDALIVASAIELGCGTLWSEDLHDGQRFGKLTIRNPFRG